MSGGLPKLGLKSPRQLVGDGTWGWSADVVGDDIVIEGASGTWFGGDNDKLDPTGETASGVKTKGNPLLVAFSLPQDGRSRSTRGCPIPTLPWHTPITVSRGDVSVTGPSSTWDRQRALATRWT